MEFRVVEMNGEIIVASDDFRAVYYKPDKLDPQLVSDVARKPRTTPCSLEHGRQRTKGARARVDCLGVGFGRRGNPRFPERAFM